MMQNKKRNKILAAVDGSGYSLAAIRYLAAVLPPLQTEVVVFHVFGGMPETFWDLNYCYQSRVELLRDSVWSDDHLNYIRDFMKKAGEILVEAGLPEDAVTIRLVDRNKGVARDILAEAEKDYQAVVVGSHGINPLGNLIMGSVANKLLDRMSQTPLCVVKGDPSPNGILSALDPSLNARKALDTLAALLPKKEQEVLLFHAVRRVDLPRGLPDVQHYIEIAEKQIIEESRIQIFPIFTEAKGVLVQAGFSKELIRSRMVTGVHSRAEAIVSEAEHGGLGTIFVGRRGLSKVEQFLMGRVSKKVVHLAEDAAVWVVA